MDIWEANSASTALTPHPCSVLQQTACNTTTNCGAGTNRQNGLCDKDGCDLNSYRLNNHTFYGPKATIDTSSKFTVVTQFITNDGTASGTLSEIRRLYVQNGKVIKSSVSNVAGISGNSITAPYCKAQKSVFGDPDTFSAKGGLAQMGSAFANGMVLVMSLWDDYTANMLWLDSTYPQGSDASKPGNARGNCATNSGVPSQIEGSTPGASVTYSNIKFGALNSTYAAA